MIKGIDGVQPGDPTRAATAILAHLDMVAAEVHAWEEVSRNTAFVGAAGASHGERP